MTDRCLKTACCDQLHKLPHPSMSSLGFVSTVFGAWLASSKGNQTCVLDLPDGESLFSGK